MKRAGLIIVLLLTCTTVVSALDLQYIFNTTQLSAIKTSADLIQASLGYDEIREIVYVTFWSNQPLDAKKIDAFNAFIAQQYSTSPKDVIYMYERLLRSMYMIEYMAALAKTNKKWKFYYYYTDTLLAGTQRYCQLLKQSIIKADPSYEAIVDERNSKIKAFAIDIVKYREALYGGGL